MRALSTATDTAVAQQITRPIELVEITLGAVFRWSTGGDLTWNSVSWSALGVRIEGLRHLAGGAMEGSLSIPNQDNAASGLVLGNTLADAPCKIYLLYGDGPYADDDAVQLFDGVLDGADIGAERVTIGFTSAGRVRELSPRMFIAPALCNFLPPRGTVINWGGERFALVGQQ